MSSSSSSPASVTSSSPSAEHAVAPTNPAQMVDLLVQSVQEDDVLYVLFYLSELEETVNSAASITLVHSYYSQSALLAAVSYDTLPRRLSAQLVLLHGADPRHEVCGLSAIEHAMLIGQRMGTRAHGTEP
ncbi:hypothetical protein JCM1840_003117 [Sporobolomyces johnsonii]